MRKSPVFAFGLALTSLFWIGPAGAARVDVDQVSSFALPAFPTTAPSAIAAAESVDGVTVQSANAEEERPTTLIAESSACITGGDDPPPRVNLDSRQQRVPRLGSELAIQAEDHATNPRIWSFRNEELTKGDAPKLVVTRGWFDRATGGVRRVDKTEITLTILSENPRVYGFRDGRMLQVVVPMAESKVGATRDEAGRVRDLACAHARVGVSLDAPASAALILATLPGEKRPHLKGRRFAQPQLRVSVSVSRTSHDAGAWVSLATGITD